MRVAHVARVWHSTSSYLSPQQRVLLAYVARGGNATHGWPACADPAWPPALAGGSGSRALADRGRPSCLHCPSLQKRVHFAHVAKGRIQLCQYLSPGQRVLLAHVARGGSATHGWPPAQIPQCRLLSVPSWVTVAGGSGSCGLAGRDVCRNPSHKERVLLAHVAREANSQGRQGRCHVPSQ